MADRMSATVLATMRERGHPAPELAADDSYFRVTLLVRSSDQGVEFMQSSEG